MPTATEITSTPTRRSAMQFGVGALIAGITAPIVASAALSPDAELIAVCDRLVRIKTAFRELFSLRQTIALEEATEDELTALYDRKSSAVAELELLEPPTTIAGVKALALAALASHDGRNSDGEIEPNCDGHWMLLVLAESLERV